MLASATADIEHTASQVPRLSQVVECWLGSPDVPRRCAFRIDGIKVVGWTRHGPHAARDGPGVPPFAGTVGQFGTLGAPLGPQRRARYGTPIPAPFAESVAIRRRPAGRTRASFCSTQRPAPSTRGQRHSFPNQVLLEPDEELIQRVASAPEPPGTTPRVQRCP